MNRRLRVSFSTILFGFSTGFAQSRHAGHCVSVNKNPRLGGRSLQALSVILTALVLFAVSFSASSALGQTIYWNGWADFVNNGSNTYSGYGGNWDTSTMNWDDGMGNGLTYSDTANLGMSDPAVVFPSSSSYNNTQSGGDSSIYIVDIYLQMPVSPTSVTFYTDNSASYYYSLNDGTGNGSGSIGDSSSGPTPLVVNGEGNGGTLYINNTNTYTGTTTVINNAYLQVQSGNPWGSSSVLIIDSSSTIDLGGNSVTAGGLSDDVGMAGNGGGGNIGNGYLTLNLSGNSYSFSGNIYDYTQLTINGPGTQVLSGNNGYSGGTTITGGATVQMGSSSALGSGPVTIYGTGSKLDINGNSVSFNGLSDGGADGNGVVGDSANGHATVTLTLNPNGGGYTYSGTIKDALGSGTDKIALVVTDGGNGNGGTQTLSGTNTYTGGTTVTGNSLSTGGVTLQLGSAHALGSSTAALVVSGGGLDLNGNSPTVGSLSDGGSGSGTILSSSGTGTLNVAMTGSNTYTFSGKLTDGGGTFGLALTGSGTMILTNNSNNFSGGTSVSAGATLRVTSASPLGTGTVTVGTGGTLSTSYLTPVTLAGGLSLQGTGQVSFNNFAGPAPGTSGTPLVKITSGGLAIAGTTHVINVSGALQAGTYDLFQFTGTAPSLTGVSISGPGAYSYTPTVVGGNEVDLTVASTAPALTWTGSGSSTWNHANTNWTGASTSFADNDAVTFGNTGAGAVNIGQTVAPQFATFNNTAGHNYSFSGSSIADGTTPTYLILNGGGSVTLSSNNTFTGGAAISGGSTLNLGSDLALGSVPPTPAPNLAFLGNGALQFGAGFTLNATRSVSIASGATATIDNLGNTAIIAGNISGAGGLTSTSSTTAGSLRLSGANTYSGATNVSNGTLALTGSLGNTAISVASAAIFAPQPGSGTISAGSSAAGSAGATLTLNPGSTFDMTDTATGTFNVQQQASFGAGNTALTINGATLNFDVGHAADALAVNVGKASVSGANSIGITPLANFSTGTFPLITAPAGGLTGTFNFTGGGTSKFLIANSVQYTMNLTNSNTAENLTVAYANPVNATIIKDTFGGTNGTSILGKMPNVANLPGGVWSASNISSANYSSPNQMALAALNGGVEIPTSSGSYTPASTLTISAGLQVNTINQNGDPFGRGMGIGFCAMTNISQPIEYASGGFIGLTIDAQGTPNRATGVPTGPGTVELDMVDPSNSNAPEFRPVAIPFPAALGTFSTSAVYTLSYTVNTSTGQISNVSLSNGTVTDSADYAAIDNYNTSGWFTVANTAYAAIVNTAANFGTGDVTNFTVSSLGPGPIVPIWLGGADSTWANAANWVNGVPGATTGTTNTDTALFNQSASTSPLTIDAGRNLQNIQFSSAGLSATTIGTTTGNALLLTSGGTITVTSDVVNSQMINAPLVLEGNYSVVSNSASATLSFGGRITSGASSGTTTLSLSGTSTGANTFSGVLANGTAGSTLALSVSGGNWVLAGANTYTSATAVSGGTFCSFWQRNRSGSLWAAVALLLTLAPARSLWPRGAL